MGTYYHLSIDNLELFPTKWELDPVSMSIFRECDKYNSIEYINEGDGYIYEKPVFIYRSSGEVIKKRLEIMGFSLPKIKEGYLKRINFLNNSDFDYIEGDIKISFEELLDNIELNFHGYKKAVGIYEKYKDNHDYIESCLGYFGDIRELIYCLILFIEKDTIIEYDISEMEFDKDENICTQYTNTLLDDFHINEKVLILTEGKTDIEFLRASFKFLFPEYYDYYSFLDFDLGNIGGSVSTIEKIVQGFVGSGIRNRIIVLFDNDVAGKHGIANLIKIKIPNNIRIGSCLEESNSYTFFLGSHIAN